MSKEITEDFIGKYAVLKIGFAKGLVGIIQKNESDMPLVSPYKHVTKTGYSTGVRFQEDIELLDLKEQQKTD